jgi:hypothetical protein
MTVLSRGDILNSKIPTIEVDVDEWGGSVFVRAPSSRSRIDMLDVVHANERAIDDYEQDQLLPEGEREGLEKVERLEYAYVELIFGIVDDKGERLFSMDDYEQLLTLNYPTILHLYGQMKTLDKRPAPIKKKRVSTRR